MNKHLNEPLPRELEAWFECPAMRPRHSALVQHHSVARGVFCTSIRHQVLVGVDSTMIYRWFKYFCYQKLVTSRGQTISAFQLWHPRDHINLEIQRHSLSGELGLVKGAKAMIVEKRDNNIPCNTVIKVIDLSRKKFVIKYHKCAHRKVLVSEDFVDTEGGS